jgi:hypothetical protein
MFTSPPAPTNPYLLITDRIDALGISYVITGSVAAMVCGKSRLTNDGPAPKPLPNKRRV